MPGTASVKSHSLTCKITLENRIDLRRVPLARPPFKFTLFHCGSFFLYNIYWN